MKYLSWNNRNGSILMITVMFAAIMAITVGSMIQLAGTESRLANGSFNSNNGLNLAEGGVEKALHALNHNDWTGWTVQDHEVVEMDEEEWDYGNNLIGRINVRITDYAGDPTVIAEGRMSIPYRPDTSKQVEVKLRRRSLFANGVTSRNRIKFSGGQSTVNSYKSSLGKWHATDNNLDNGSVASPSVEVDAIDLSNARVRGRVATGGQPPEVGPNGEIRGDDTESGQKIDESRIALDFDSSFDPMDPPDTDGGTYIPTIDSSMTLGDPTAPEGSEPMVYRVDNIDLENEVLDIVGPVIIYVTEDIGVGGGSGELRVSEGGSAAFYVDGDIDIGGNGSVNATNDPASLLIYGTNPISQQFNLHGNAEWQAAVYAPNALINLKGGGTSGSMSGAVVGQRVDINGNYSFHYDEDLEDLYGPDPSYRMHRWREVHLVSEKVSFK